jgi:hypothetical protein
MNYQKSWFNVGEQEWIRPIVISRTPDDDAVDVGEGVMILSEGHYSSAKELVEQLRHVWTQHWVRRRKQLMDNKITVLSSAEKTKVPAGTVLTYVERATKEREDENVSPSMDESSVRFEFNDKTNKLKVILNNENHAVVFSKNLADILGIRQYKRKANVYVSEAEIDVNRGCHMMFVYCDIVQDSIVGDVKAPLLRTVTTRGRYGESVREVFTKPIYVPLRTNQFQSLEIAIKSETGQPIAFNYGNSCVTLHFRRVGNNLLSQ